SRPKQFTAELQARVPMLIEQGLSTKEIAEALGLTEKSLRVLCCRNGISLRRVGTSISAAVSPSCYKALVIEADRMRTTVPNFVVSILEVVVKDKLFEALELELPERRI